MHLNGQPLDLLEMCLRCVFAFTVVCLSYELSLIEYELSYST